MIDTHIIGRIPKKRVIINLGDPQNKFGTKSGPSKFILMTLFLGMRPILFVVLND